MTLPWRMLLVVFLCPLISETAFAKTKNAAPPTRIDQPAVTVLDNGLKPSDVEQRPWRSYVAECADNLIKHGTDQYGLIHQPMLVSTLDVRTLAPPKSVTRAEYPWRVFLSGQALERLRGCESLVDQSTIDVFYLLSERLNKPKYARFADAYLRCVMGTACEKGLFWWGWHRYYDVDADLRKTSKGNHHELHINRPRWERMWKLNPMAVDAELEAIWKWHIINKDTGEHNRHANGKRGRSFPMSGGEFLYAFAFQYSKTGDPDYLRRALLVADHHWQSRNPATGLIPGNAGVDRKRFDGWHMDTSVTGIYCYFLLKSYELTGEETFRDHALTYLNAYARYAYDPATGKFFGSLRLDGKPEPGPRAKKGYANQEPRGFADLWSPGPLGYEQPLYTAQAYAYAYQLTNDPAMLDVARKWAAWIRKAPPSKGCLQKNNRYARYAKRFSPYGVYAGHYGRTISFFLHLYALTGEKGYLADARRLGREAVSRLYCNGLFRGHPAQAHYCSLDGVGFLLYALMQLDAVEEHPDDVVGATAIPLGKGNATIAFDNW